MEAQNHFQRNDTFIYVDNLHNDVKIEHVVLISILIWEMYQSDWEKRIWFPISYQWPVS